MKKKKAMKTKTLPGRKRARQARLPLPDDRPTRRKAIAYFEPSLDVAARARAEALEISMSAYLASLVEKDLAEAAEK